MRLVIALALSALSLTAAKADAATADAPPRIDAPIEAPRPEPAHVDPALARANADMLAVYRALSLQVAGDAQLDLWESQRLWSRYADQFCQFEQDDAARLARPGRHETQSECLARTAATREAELKNGLQTVGPWTFLRLTDHRIHWARGTLGSGPIESAVTWMQLAKPVAEAGRRWNAAVARQLDQTMSAAFDRADTELGSAAAERDISFNAGVDIAAVTPDLIDVSIHASADPIGPAPPRSAARRLIWSMSMERPIDATDLFDPRSLWRPSLAQMAADRLDPGAAEGAPASQVQAIAGLAADPARWTLRPGGLLVDLSNSASVAPALALVPWPLLSPYLKRPLLVEPAALVQGPTG